MLARGCYLLLKKTGPGCPSGGSVVAVAAPSPLRRRTSSGHGCRPGSSVVVVAVSSPPVVWAWLP
eukprot:2511789-Pyramimonas_sp.AAC.1